MCTELVSIMIKHFYKSTCEQVNNAAVCLSLLIREMNMTNACLFSCECAVYAVKYAMADLKIDTCHFLARQSPLLGKGKDWLTQHQDNILVLAAWTGNGAAL